MKRSKLRVLRDHFSPGHMYMSGHPSAGFMATNPSSMTAPLLKQNRQHYRYKSRFQLIPVRNAALHAPVIIRHPPTPPSHHHPHSYPLPHHHHLLQQNLQHPHHPPYKYLTIRDNQGHLRHPYRNPDGNKHSFFNNCWLL